jgi:hypothetical protein
MCACAQTGNAEITIRGIIDTASTHTWVRISRVEELDTVDLGKRWVASKSCGDREEMLEEVGFCEIEIRNRTNNEQSVTDRAYIQECDDGLPSLYLYSNSK